MPEATPEEKAAAEKAAAEKAAAEAAAAVESAEVVGVLTVGSFTFRDQQTGETTTGVGVVAEVADGVLVVLPLAPHALRVDPAEFTPLAADDV